MLQRYSKLKDSDDHSDWPQRLFDQAKQAQDRKPLMRDSVINDSSSFLIPHHKCSTSHWTDQLFNEVKTDRLSADKLIIQRDHQVIGEFVFREDISEITLGSHRKADIILKWPKINSFHVKILCEEGKYFIQDLGSERGTFLNGKRIHAHQTIELSEDAAFSIMAFSMRVERSKKLQTAPYLPDKQSMKADQQSHPLPKTSLGNDSDMFTSFASISHLAVASWQHEITELVVSGIIDETPDVKTFRLTGLSPIAFSYLPGQFVTLILVIDGRKVQRSYSMSSSPSRPYALDLTIKRVSGGLVSNWLCDHLKLDSRLMIKGPYGRFSCLQRPRPAEKLLFIGAGSGITPLMSMIRWLFDTAARIDSKALFSFRHPEDIIFCKELAMISASNPMLDLAVTLSGEKINQDQWNGFSGRVDHAMLETFVHDLHEREIYLCGPELFMENIKHLLVSRNYPLQRLHCESFGSIPERQNQHVEKTQAIASENQMVSTQLHSVTFIKSNKVVKTDEKTSLLQLAHASGIEIDFDCRAGSCGECMIRCLSGQVSMSQDCEIDEYERKQGWIFSCCAFARSDLVINA